MQKLTDEERREHKKIQRRALQTAQFTHENRRLRQNCSVGKGEKYAGTAFLYAKIA